MYEEDSVDELIVKVARVPGRVVDVSMAPGSTILDALGSAGIAYENCSISVNGEPVDLNRALYPMETILIVNQHIKGAADKIGKPPTRTGFLSSTRRIKREMAGQTVLKGNDPERAVGGVVIPLDVYSDIVELCTRSGHNEVGWFGTMSITRGRVDIDEVFLPAQVVSPVTTDITGLQGVAQDLIAAGRIDDLDRLHFWGHCHPGTSAPSPSPMDEDTFDELSRSCPSCLMGIFSQDGRKAYFRLRHHGLDVRMGWKVVWAESGKRFEDFSGKVTVHRAVAPTFRRASSSYSRGWTFGGK